MVARHLWRLLWVAGVKQSDLVEMARLYAQDQAGLPISARASLTLAL